MNYLVRHVLCALMPSGGELPGVADTDLDGFLATYREQATPLVVLGLMAGSAVFVVTPVLTLRRPVLSTMLEPEQLDEHANAIASHPIYLVRQAIMVPKMVAGMCWGSDPKVREMLNHEPYLHDEPQWVRS